MCVCVSHSHGRAVNRVFFYELPRNLPVFVLHQVQQRVTHLHLVDANDGVSHGENLHHVCCDPVIPKVLNTSMSISLSNIKLVCYNKLVCLEIRSQDLG